jgi:hypothetical protein
VIKKGDLGPRHTDSSHEFMVKNHKFLTNFTAPV